MSFTNQTLKLESDALPEDALLVTRLSGQEQLSGMFRFELQLVSADPKIDLEKVLYEPARLGIQYRLGPGMTAFRYYSGMFSELQLLEQGQNWTSYRAVLVPDLFKTTEFYRSRIFMDRSIEDLIKDVLEGQGVGLQNETDFRLALKRASGGASPEREVYPQREYVVQYEETDYDFLCRWLEHEGVFFFFENDGTSEKVVFADTMASYKPVVPGASTYPYRPQARSQAAGSDAGKDDEEVLSFGQRVVRQPKKVALNDYNWRNPASRLNSERDVFAKGAGHQTEYNDHFKTPEQGAKLAEVRAQEYHCRSQLYEGQSTCRAFRPGRTFELDEHFRADFNANFLITRVSHEAEQSINLEASTVTGATYRNQFEAIPADRDWRPERLTEWPSIKGVMHAKVDGAGAGDFAELDEEGRYLVKIPFDEAHDETPDGESSRRVRMAQPYAGVDSGMHFPLLKGTEVLITHIDGDPDRPVIAGAVPNPDTHSPVDQANNRQNRITTTSGNVVVYDDNPALAGIFQTDASGTVMLDDRHPSSGGGGGPSGGGGGEAALRGGDWRARLRERPAREDGHPSGASALAAERRERGPIGLGGPELPPGEGLALAIKGGSPLPPGIPSLLRDLGPGQGTCAEPDKPTTIEEFVAQNPDDSTFIDAGVGKATGKGASFSGYSLDAKSPDRSVKIRAGDHVFLRQHLKLFTYADVSEDYSWGTGGIGYHLEEGDTFDENYHLGAATSLSMHLGSDTSMSLSMGAAQSLSMRLGADASTSLFIGATDSMSMTLAAEKSMSINIGPKLSGSISITNTNDTSIDVGPRISTSIAVGPRTSTDLSVSTATSTSLTVGAFNSTSLTIAAKNDVSLTLAASNEVDITIAAKNSLSLTIAAKTDISLTLAVENNISLTMAARTNLSLVLAADTDLNIVLAAKTEIGLFVGAKTSIDIAAALLTNISIAAMVINIGLTALEIKFSAGMVAEYELVDGEIKLNENKSNLNDNILSLFQTK